MNPHEIPKHYSDTRLMDLLISRKIPWSEGNIMKYVFRWREKDGIKDLYKARDYLNALIAHEEVQQPVEVQKTFPELFNKRVSDQVSDCQVKDAYDLALARVNDAQVNMLNTLANSHIQKY